jgi:hypothetical protein
MMKKLSRLIAVLAVVIIGLGFYRGWFTLTGGRETESNHVDVKLSVDTDKVKHDADAVTGGSKGEDSLNE